MICKKCRNNVKTDFKYCPYCGERVISDFHESYGELTPPFIIEDKGQEDEAVKFYAPDPTEKQPDFDRYSTAPPNASGADKPDGGYQNPSRYDSSTENYKTEEPSSSSYFVYPEELMYGSLDDSKQEDGYSDGASRATDYRYEIPKAEARYDAPKTEPRYDAPKTEPRYDAPKTEPRYETPKAEPYYVYGGETRDAGRQDSYSEPQPRDNARSVDEGMSFDAPDQCIQIDMSFAEPESVTAGQSGHGSADADNAPYYVYGRDASGERENVLPFDETLADELSYARTKQSGSAIAAKLALILLIVVLAVAVSIFGYRYVTGISDNGAWIAGNTSSVDEPSSSAVEPSSSAVEPSSSAVEPSSSAVEPSSSVASTSAATNP